jgi:hypothetical protein
MRAEMQRLRDLNARHAAPMPAHFARAAMMHQAIAAAVPRVKKGRGKK